LLFLWRKLENLFFGNIESLISTFYDPELDGTYDPELDGTFYGNIFGIMVNSLLV